MAAADVCFPETTDRGEDSQALSLYPTVCLSFVQQTSVSYRPETAG